MIVELYGLPGSGKSTICRAIAALHHSSVVCIDVRSRWERYVYIMLFILRHPILTLRWLSVLSRERLLCWYKLHLLSVTLAKVAKAQALSQKKIRIIDEGLLQRLLTVFDTPVPTEKIYRFLPKTYPTQVIHMRGGDFYRFEREEKKDNSPRVKMGKAYFESWKALQRENNERIGDALRHIGMPVHTYTKELVSAKHILTDLMKHTV